MTYRLIGLMSFVLLLSLAAFALLMSSYHAEVMNEVTDTISQVGRATMRSFEYGVEGDVDRAAFLSHVKEQAADGGPHPAPPGGVWVHEQWERAPVGDEKGACGVVVMQARFPRVILRPTGDGSGNVEITASVEQTERHILHFEGDRVEVVAESGDGEGAAAQDLFFVQVESIRAEADPAGETVLRIPTLRSDEEDAADPPEDLQQVELTAGVGEAANRKLLRREEILLPISTDKFQHLFTAFRGRTLFLLFGVFVVGTVLSASLAARFTRPVRRLDAGIRRLTDGDLDVEVDARGKDEMGRLARAFNEMTRRLRASRAREREMTRREKLSALGRLAAGVAHDVRNPLHSIGLTLQNLQETARPEDDGRGREFDRSLVVIREEIGRLDRLVENFLRFARTERRVHEPVDLAQLIRETAQLVEKEAERRGIDVEVVAEGEVVAVPANVASIRSSILNLVLNSFEAMTEGGSVRLTVRPGDGEVVLEVADTGPGIPEEDQERVFDFAYTTRQDGNGLGLAMVHQVVVEDHGGRVSLESRAGEGTRVQLALPVAPSGAGS